MTPEDVPRTHAVLAEAHRAALRLALGHTSPEDVAAVIDANRVLRRHIDLTPPTVELGERAR